MPNSSHRSAPSIFKSGWIYVWCLLVIGILALDRLDFWQPLDRFNQNLWATSSPNVSSNHLADPLYRIVNIRFDQEGAQQLKQLANLFPKAIFALSGSYSDTFLQQLNADSMRSLLTRSIWLSAAGKTKVSALKVTSLSPISHLFQKAIPTVKTIQWQAKRFPIYQLQPRITHAKTSTHNLVWRSEDQIYPTFLGQLLSQYFTTPMQPNDLSIEIGIQNHLLIKQRILLLGINGEVIGSQQQTKVWNFNQLIDFTETHPAMLQRKLIIYVDDLSIPASKSLANTLASVINSQYLTSNWLSKSVEYLLLLLALLSFVPISRFSWKQNSFLAIVSVLFLLLLQSFFMSHLDWLSIHLVVLICLVTATIRLAYLNEQKTVSEHKQKNNRLLSDSSRLFYQNQKLDKLFNHLAGCEPDDDVINSLFQTALDAETQQNFAAAKQLHQWILENNQQFKPSLDRMRALFPNELKAANERLGNSINRLEIDTLKLDNLDHTRIVNPAMQGQNLPNAGLVNIKQFGRYQVEGILGRGAMGVVFQGVDPKINRQVAIKTLMINQQLDGESLEVAKKRFFREAETAGKLSHAHIVTIYDVGEQPQPESDQTLGYIAMDLLTGAPLSEYTKPERLLPIPLVYQLMIQMTDALEYAHKQKVVHRDIKPANILFDDELQRGTLTDFGIAYMADHSKTKTGTIMGSPYYMSPEQIIGIKVDGRSDIFSLGVTFYQLLSGQLPFTGESIATVAFQITKSKHQSVRQWNKRLPSSAARITNKALQKDKNKRYQNMGEFKQALIKALARDFKKAPLQ